MASMHHEGLLLLFRNRPELAPELLRDVLGLPLPRWTEARVEALFEVLDARGLKVEEAERQWILACTDLMQLKR